MERDELRREDGCRHHADRGHETVDEVAVAERAERSGDAELSNPIGSTVRDPLSGADLERVPVGVDE